MMSLFTKTLSTGIILLTLSGCETPSLTSQTTQTGQCPETPEKLDSSRVQAVDLGADLTALSGQLRAGQTMGYSFKAEAGQKLDYQTGNDLCIWIYAPNNQIITSKDLSSTGNYIVQVAVPKGSTTFDLELGLDVVQASTSTPTPTPTPVQPTRPSADEFVRNHYIDLNNRRYSETWERLSPNFQQKAVSYSEYQKWWNSVERIRIGNINVVNQNENEAIVDAELEYIMNTGKTVPDPKSLIYLVWSEDSNSWLFNDKTQP